MAASLGHRITLRLMPFARLAQERGVDLKQHLSPDIFQSDRYPVPRGRIASILSNDSPLFIAS